MPHDELSEIGNSETRPPEPDPDPCSLEEATLPPEHRSVREQLAQFLMQNTEPAAVPAACPFAKRDDDVRQLCQSLAIFKRALRNEFTDSQLIQARVLCPDQQSVPRDPFDPMSPPRATGSGLKLTPVLMASPLIIEWENDRVLDVTSDAGTLWRKDPPILRHALESHPRRRQPVDLFVAESAAVPILKGLRLPVVSIAGMAELNGPQMRKLFASQSIDEAPYYRVTIVAWKLAGVTNELAECPKLALQRIHDWQRVVGCDPEKTLIRAWAPHTNWFEKIKIAIEFRDMQLTKLMIRASVRADARNAVDAWQAILDSRDVSLATDVIRLRTAIAQGRGALNRKDAKFAAQGFRRRNFAIINRYYRAAEAAQNPAESLQWLTLAREHEEFVREHPLVIAADQIAAGQPASFQNLDTSASAVRDHQVARMLQLTKPLSSKR